MNLNQSIEGYIRYLRGRYVSDAHVQSVMYRMRRLVASVGGETNLADITPEMIADHFHDLETNGLAYATLAGQKSTLRAFWRWLVEQYGVDDVTRVLLAHRYNYDYRPVRNRPAPRDDLNAVLRVLPEFAAHRNHNPCDVRDAALVSLAADSAKRRGELWNLRRRDIEMALRRGEKIGEKTNGRTIYTASSHGKTGQTEFVFFDETAMLLRNWLVVMPRSSTWLWVNVRTGKRLRVDAMGLAFRRICKYAGVPLFRFHAIRKRAVTDIIEASGDTKIGQLLAGHADQRTTQLHYNDVDAQRVRRQAAQLAAMRRYDDDGDSLAASLFGGVAEAD